MGGRDASAVIASVLMLMLCVSAGTCLELLGRDNLSRLKCRVNKVQVGEAVRQNMKVCRSLQHVVDPKPDVRGIFFRSLKGVSIYALKLPRGDEQMECYKITLSSKAAKTSQMVRCKYRHGSATRWSHEKAQHKPVGCHDWKPENLNVRTNTETRTVTISWTNALKKGRLRILWTCITNNTVMNNRVFTAYEVKQRDITRVTFKDIQDGHFKAMIHSFGCTDCIDYKRKGSCDRKFHFTEPVIVDLNKQEEIMKPTGCYDWKPESLFVTPDLNDQTATVTWAPVFKKGAFKILWIDHRSDNVIFHKEFKAKEIYEKNITSFTFKNITDGVFVASVQTQSCYDCKDLELKGTCSSTIHSSDPITIEKKKPTGCYDWKPESLFVTRDLNDKTATVTWAPVFKKSAFKVLWIDHHRSDNVIYDKEFKAYEIYEKNITSFTFKNITDGVFVASVQTQSCYDCEDLELKGTCSSTIHYSDPITIDRSNMKLPENVLTRKLNPDEVIPRFLMYATVALLLVVISVIIIVFAVRKGMHSCCCLKSIASHQSKSRDVVYTRVGDGSHKPTRILVLYGLDHECHVEAVRYFAQLLRLMLNVEVIVDRETNTGDVNSTSQWIKRNIPASSMVIIVTSEALYRTAYLRYLVNNTSPSSQSFYNAQRYLQTLIEDPVAEYGSVALDLLKETATKRPTIIQVSFGYTSSEHAEKLWQLYKFIPRRFYTVTKVDAHGSRSLDLSAICGSDVKTPNGDVVQQFLNSVDKMDKYYNNCENSVSNFELAACVSDTESIVTVEHLCRQCQAVNTTLNEWLPTHSSYNSLACTSRLSRPRPRTVYQSYLTIDFDDSTTVPADAPEVRSVEGVDVPIFSWTDGDCESQGYEYHRSDSQVSRFNSLGSMSGTDV